MKDDSKKYVTGKMFKEIRKEIADRKKKGLIGIPGTPYDFSKKLEEK